MSTNKPKSLSELLTTKGSKVRELAEKAKSRLDLADHIRNGVSENLAMHISYCNIRDDNTLVVIADSPEWAARLRFEDQTLLSLCREKHPAAARVKIKVSHDGG